MRVIFCMTSNRSSACRLCSLLLISNPYKIISLTVTPFKVDAHNLNTSQFSIGKHNGYEHYSSDDSDDSRHSRGQPRGRRGRAPTLPRPRRQQTGGLQKVRRLSAANHPLYTWLLRQHEPQEDEGDRGLRHAQRVQQRPIRPGVRWQLHRQPVHDRISTLDRGRASDGKNMEPYLNENISIMFFTYILD